MSYEFGIVILAAGEGKRLKMECPKPLAPASGRAIVDYIIDEAQNFLAKRKGMISLVTGHQRERVERHICDRYGKEISFAVQKKQLGTADALRSYFDQVKEGQKCEYTLILCADTPLIRAGDLEALNQELVAGELDGVAASFYAENPYGYGRIVRGEMGFHIVEEKDASDEVREIQEVNSGLYVVKTNFLLGELAKIGSNNKSNEFYLTDLFRDEFNVAPVIFEDAYKFIGVNTLEQLEMIEAYLRLEKVTNLRDEGVRFIDSTTVYIDWDASVASGSVIGPGVAIHGKSVVESGAKIGMGSIIDDSQVESNVEIKPYTCLEKSVVRKNAVVGPFARLRPEADIGSNAKVGNFVEIKKTKLDDGAKVSHLSYVGDAEIGSNTNIGCGFITCNYDGANKHKTIIGKNSFIGSDSQMVAPIEIGDDCFVASGSTITSSMSSGSFAISRCRQVTKEGLAVKFIKKK